MNRYSVFAASLVGLAGVFAATCLAGEPAKPAKPNASDTLWAYIGTYTGKESKGIYLCRLDLAKGTLELAGLAGEAQNPSFLAVHPTRPRLYAVGELDEFKHKRTGAIDAFSIQPKTGKLTLLNQQPSGGTGPCHLTVDRTGRWLLAANYGGGSIICLPIGHDGRLGDSTSFIQHRGTSVDPGRQTGPHAHGIVLDAANHFVFVPDLGLDKVMVYRFNPSTGRLSAADPPSASVAPGAGPRHIAFHPNGRWAYVICEMGNTVTAFQYDAAAGKLQTLETLSTLPADFHGQSWTAEVAVHPSGKFLYGSNRGHNSIAIFAIDGDTGKPRLFGHQSSGGKTPRNFAIDPTGRYLLAANQDSHNIVVFRINRDNGKLEPTGSEVKVSSPVCVTMLPPVE